MCARFFGPLPIDIDRNPQPAPINEIVEIVDPVEPIFVDIHVDEQQHQLPRDVNIHVDEQQHQLPRDVNIHVDEQQHQLPRDIDNHVDEQQHQLPRDINNNTTVNNIFGNTLNCFITPIYTLYSLLVGLYVFIANNHNLSSLSFLMFLVIIPAGFTVYIINNSSHQSQVDVPKFEVINKLLINSTFNGTNFLTIFFLSLCLESR